MRVRKALGIVEEVQAQRREDDQCHAGHDDELRRSVKRRWPRSNDDEEQKDGRNRHGEQSGGEVRVEVQADQCPGDDDPVHSGSAAIRGTAPPAPALESRAR